MTYVESETLMNKQQVARTKVVFETSWALGGGQSAEWAPNMGLFFSVCAAFFVVEKT